MDKITKIIKEFFPEPRELSYDDGSHAIMWENKQIKCIDEIKEIIYGIQRTRTLPRQQQKGEGAMKYYFVYYSFKKEENIIGEGDAWVSMKNGDEYNLVEFIKNNNKDLGNVIVSNFIRVSESSFKKAEIKRGIKDQTNDR